MTTGRARILGALTLIVGSATLWASPRGGGDESVSWESLLAPYSRGELLPGGFRIDAIRRGPANDIVVLVKRPGEEPGVEVHVLRRGQWPNVHESESFSIGYETPHSPAAEREEITERIANTIRSRDRGLPAPDAIPLTSTDDASLLFWWLDALRGWRGALIGLGTALLGAIAIVRSRALGLGGVLVGVACLLAAAAGVPSRYSDLGGAWLLPGALALLFAARGHRGLGRKDWTAALAVTLVALSLRLALGPWGPLHVNGYGPRFITGAARDAAVIAPYGPGYAELFAPVARLAPTSPDWAIFACNALLSSLVATLTFALGRSIGIPRAGAAAAALVLAIDPIAVRTAATESYFPAVAALCATAAVAVAGGAAEVGGGWRAVGWFAAAALLLAQAARIHPAAWLPVTAVPLVTLAGRAERTSQRLLAFLAGGLLIGGLMVLTSGDVLVDTFGNVRGGTLMRPVSPPSLLPIALLAAATAGYALVARQWLAVAAFVSLASVILTRHAYAQSWIWQQAYDRMYLALPILAAFAAVPVRLLRLRSLAWASALLVAVVWFKVAPPILAARTTDHLEYRWLREQLRRIPPRCRVIHVAAAARRDLEIPTYVRPPAAPAVAINPNVPHTIDEGLAPAQCLYYVHTSLCSNADGRPACEAIESRLTLVPVARTSFPALPSSWILDYDSEPVEVFIARAEQAPPLGAPHHEEHEGHEGERE